GAERQGEGGRSRSIDQVLESLGDVHHADLPLLPTRRTSVTEPLRSPPMSARALPHTVRPGSVLPAIACWFRSRRGRSALARKSLLDGPIYVEPGPVSINHQTTSCFSRRTRVHLFITPISIVVGRFARS